MASSPHPPLLLPRFLLPPRPSLPHRRALARREASGVRLPLPLLVQTDKKDRGGGGAEDEAAKRQGGRRLKMRMTMGESPEGY